MKKKFSSALFAMPPVLFRVIEAGISVWR